MRRWRCEATLWTQNLIDGNADAHEGATLKTRTTSSSKHSKLVAWNSWPKVSPPLPPTYNNSNNNNKKEILLHSGRPWERKQQLGAENREEAIERGNEREKEGVRERERVRVRACFDDGDVTASCMWFSVTSRQFAAQWSKASFRNFQNLYKNTKRVRS